MTTTFSLKQGETRTSSGPIPYPLSSERRVHLAEASVEQSPQEQVNSFNVIHFPHVVGSYRHIVFISFQNCCKKQFENVLFLQLVIII